MKRFVCVLFSLVLVSGVSLPSYASASTINKENCQQCNNVPLSKEDIRKDGGIVKDIKVTDENSQIGIEIHAHQLKDGYKTKFCSFELKSPQMEGFIKNKHAK
ncbi:hypothetical protein [Bacillus cereus]|uniref:hypothetical protein n=1 Tax=Bacillus cereus TaxID=1396 RepID=UPI0034D745BF